MQMKKQRPMLFPPNLLDSCLKWPQLHYVFQEESTLQGGVAHQQISDFPHFRICKYGIFLKLNPNFKHGGLGGLIESSHYKKFKRPLPHLLLPWRFCVAVVFFFFFFFLVKHMLEIDI